MLPERQQLLFRFERRTPPLDVRRSALADDKQTIAALQEQLTALASTLSENVGLREQLTSTRCELADAVTREQVATGRLSVLVNMDKDEKDLAERIATLKLELAELETSACSASQGALSTLVESTAQAYPAASPAQVLGDTPVEAAVLEMDPTKSDEAARDFKMRLGMRIAAGPDAFFALADTKQEDKLSPQGWLESCKSSLVNVEETRTWTRTSWCQGRSSLICATPSACSSRTTSARRC